MTPTCRICGREIAQRFVGTVVVWGHLTNPRNDHHYAVPANQTAAGVQTRSRAG